MDCRRYAGAELGEELLLPRHFGEPLRGNLAGLWRYRVGDYRIICEIQEEQLVVLALAVGHRRDVYTRQQ